MRTGGRADRQTDMTKLIVAFRNFAKAPKKSFEVVEIEVSHMLRPIHSFTASFTLLKLIKQKAEKAPHAYTCSFTVICTRCSLAQYQIYVS